VNAFARYDVRGRLIEERPLEFGEMVDWYARPSAAMRRDGDDGRQWYLVRRVGGSDAHALDWLKRLAVVTYYPMIRELRPVPRKRLSRKQRQNGHSLTRPKMTPFFPGYYFVWLDFARDDWHRLADIARIGGLVCEGNLPVAIGDGLIDALREREVDGAIPGKTPVRLLFKAAEAVRMADGPFAGFFAKVENLPDYDVQDVDADTRIGVTVDIFGRPTLIDCAIGQIEKL
jgi:transcription antitermination factor NusG